MQMALLEPLIVCPLCAATFTNLYICKHFCERKVKIKLPSMPNKLHPLTRLPLNPPQPDPCAPPLPGLRSMFFRPEIRRLPGLTLPHSPSFVACLHQIRFFFKFFPESPALVHPNYISAVRHSGTVRSISIDNHILKTGLLGTVCAEQSFCRFWCGLYFLKYN